ncbi:MAG: type VI secretion system tip protein TssI/VgrG [Polyangiaceae bacterium]|jgi:type VI secretion system secreted protein VgrG
MQTFGTVGTFASTAIAASLVRVVSVEGTEQLGQLYEFRVTIRHSEQALTEDQLSDLLLAPCSITLENGDPIHGIAREVSIRESVPGRGALYEIVVVPTVWLLTISKLSRIFQQLSVAGMAADVLQRYGLTDHSDLRISGAPRDFCMQYEESDWDYLQRWFEHEGYFYWFEHSASGEKLVVADDNAKTAPISGTATLPYREKADLQRTEDSVFDWRGLQRRIPARVILKDYNDQKPLLPMVGLADVDRQKGFGVFFEYGDNFDTTDAGNVLAKVRAERILTERLTLYGVTDCTRFHVGHSFELAEHFDEGQNRKYLITAIRHRAGLLPSEEGDREVSGYRAEFEAIPLATQYRPPRRTAWPSVHGVMHGHIDSDSAGTFSTLDDQGRYRVRFPFDSTGKVGESCSTWVRMAQQYAGSGYGSHHPLHKGAEVLVAFYDGDPDRPLIVGSVPNPVTPGPSTGANATQSIIKTHSGIQTTMDDQVKG